MSFPKKFKSILRFGDDLVPKLSKEELKEFLLKSNVAKVATLSLNGWPAVNPAWYLWEEDRIWLNGRKGFGGITSSWIENIEQDPRVTVLIDTDDRSLHQSTNNWYC
jgi:nitroimidazol reductase NimA-like FMN-containing flavoprotein (pyridoxamine 5'-phosphate oxidase superfamily)